MNRRPPAPSKVRAGQAPGRTLEVTNRGGEGRSGSGSKRPAKLDKMVKRTNMTPEFSGSKKVLPKIKSNIERFEGMLAGSLTDLLPKPPSEVRIFLSSTFSDYRSERNWLTREAFSELKQFCAARDLDFKVVDMRWGVTDDATNEHVTEKLCLSEIATCKRVSLGPNFVAMLGNRFGYQPLPYAFIAKEFEILYNEAKEIKHPEAEILHKWYSRDDNNVPPVYCIKPIRENIANFGDHSAGMEEARRQAAGEWGQTLLVIHDVLRAAATSLADKKTISQSRKHDFYKSVTEIEVTDGIVEAESPERHALCYLRDYDGLDETRLGDQNALRNIDGLKVDGKLVINKEVTSYQDALKNTHVPRTLKPENIRRYKVPWHDGGINPADHPRHAVYLEQLCADFVVDVKRLIEVALYQKQNVIPQTEYYTEFYEAQHHSHFCLTKCATFRGQEEPLKQIKDYLTNPTHRRPVIVHAESGVGKTSIMAMAMKSVTDWFGPESIRMIRFLGTSPLSGTIYDILFAVMGQLADHFNMILEPVSYKNINRIIESFPRFLRNVSRKTKVPVYIFLDSIDQLSPKDNAFYMHWLPEELPPKINIILSTIPNFGHILSNTRQLIKDDKCFIEVKPLPVATGKEIIQSYLSSSGRTVTPKQKKLIIDCMKHEPSPLFLKLFLDKALSWRSVTQVNAIRLETSVREAITHLFEDLEVKFGQRLIQRALGYITVGMDGLSELELEDVLSCDDSVLDEVYVYHDPPVDGVIRVPPLLWARIRIHVNEYLTERRSYGKTTLYWYHRQFIEVATLRYASGNDGKVLHRRLAELYLSESGVEKDITLSHRKGLTIAKADRQVTPQPMVEKNRRMLQALPYHLRNALNVGYLKQVALCNLRFLMTRMAGFSLDVIIKDFTECIEMFSKENPEKPDHELEMMVDALKSARGALRTSAQLPLQILTRLQHDRKNTPHISNLLDKARVHVETSPTPALLPMYPCLVNVNEMVWSSAESSICSMSDDKTRMVMEIRGNDNNDGVKPEKFIIMDAAAQRVMLEEEIQPENGSIPCLTGNGKKLISCHALKSLPTSNDSQKGKPKAPNQPKIGDFVVNISEFPEPGAAALSSSKLVNLGALKIKELHIFSTTRDGNLICIIYNKSMITLYDIKSGTETWSTTHELLGNVTEIVWFGSKYCVCVCTGASNEQGLFIVSNAPKKKGTYVKLPGKIDPETCSYLPDVSEVLCFAAVDAGRQLLVIDLKAGAIKESVLTQSNMKLQYSLGKEQQSLLVNSDDKLYLMERSDEATLTECQIEGSKKIPSEITCVSGDNDSSLVLLGDSKGSIHVYNWNNSTLKALGQNKLEEGPIRHMHLNEEEEVLISVNDTRIRLWNWRLLKRKCSVEGTKSAKKSSGVTTEISLLNYQKAASAIFSPDSDSLMTVSPSDSVKIWQLEDQQKVAEFGKQVDPKQVLFVCEGTVLVAMDRKEHKIFAWEVSTGAELDALKYLHGKALAMTKSLKAEKVYLLSDIEGKFCITVIDMVERKITKTIPLAQRFENGTDIEIELSENGKYLFIIVPAAEKQLEILLKSEKKNNLYRSFGKNLFYAVDLKKASGDLKVANRQLSTLQCLGETWLVHKDSSLIIGRSRVSVSWDVDTGSNDQRMAKGTKIAQFYRPWWIEEDSDQAPLCYGPTSCMVKSGNGEIVGMGYADGYVIFYASNTGLRVGGGQVENRKRPHHQGGVTKLVLSSDGRWAASYGWDLTLKFWCLPQQELASIKLGLDVKEITFSPDNRTLAVLGVNGLGASSVLLFRVVGNSIQGEV